MTRPNGCAWSTFEDKGPGVIHCDTHVARRDGGFSACGAYARRRNPPLADVSTRTRRPVDDPGPLIELPCVVPGPAPR